MKLDPLDIVILKELNADGRASFREIAKRASLSTPTVSARFERMNRAGLIRKFVPLLNLDASDSAGIMAFVHIKALVFRLDAIVSKIIHMPEVTGAFTMAGKSNLVIKISVPNTRMLQRFLTNSELRKLGVEVTESQIITRTIKDEHPLPFAGEFAMKLRCDLCKGEITTSRPYTIKVASMRYYFCCKTCRRTYLDKHEARIRSLNKKQIAVS